MGIFGAFHEGAELKLGAGTVVEAITVKVGRAICHETSIPIPPDV